MREVREVNDQYPEYAEPYEPVKGGKHHKGIYGTRGPNRRNNPDLFPFFMLIGLLLILLTFMRPGNEEPGVEPQASSKETTVTTETTPDEPEEPDTPELENKAKDAARDCAVTAIFLHK